MMLAAAPSAASRECLPWSPEHWAAIIATLLLALGFIIAGRALRAHERQIGAALGFFGLAWAITSCVYWLIFRDFDITKSLPLHACDLSAFFAPLALLTPRRWLRATGYFWAWAFCMQAFVSPVVPVGPSHLHYWTYWGTHGCILACAAYDMAVRGFRPTLRDVWRALLVCYVWLAIAIPLNIAFKANYGYVGNSAPDVPSLVDVLGPWPQRMLSIIAVGHAVFLIFWLIGRMVPGGESTGWKPVLRTPKP